jgi:diguanylate cyclase (GGDEF)-like protein
MASRTSLGRDGRATLPAVPERPDAAAPGPLHDGLPAPDQRPRTRVSKARSSGHDALRRLASELSGSRDLDELLSDVVDESTRLFAADRVGVWLYDDAREHPLELRAGRDIPAGVAGFVSTLRRDSDAAGLRALRSRSVVLFRGLSDPGVTPELRELYAEVGIHGIAFVPVVFRGDPLGVIVLYHHGPHDWTTDEVSLARSFGDTIATALGNARLAASVDDLAARLRAVQDLAVRLNGITDIALIGEAIVAEARSLLHYDTIRVYRVDREAGWCEPIAFQGIFLGRPDPPPEALRVRVGAGLTGWVAEHGEAIVIGNAQRDERAVIVGADNGPESMLVVPMTLEDRVRGVIVVSQLGEDTFSEDDRTTLQIFAGYATQALVNAERLDQLRRQQAELEHQLASQRRLLAINERLLSTLDPSGVLDLIADSLKAVVAYDSLTIYRIDLARSVRRPVIARDRFAELILDYEAPLGIGLTGWAVDHREAVLANDAQLDPRSIQIPGTPEEPESLIVVPLIVEGEVLGTLNIGRMGREEAHFSQNEFEMTKLFAAQAAIALRNAETHGEVKVQAERDALTGLRNHGSFQRELGAAVASADGRPFAVLMMDLDRFKGYNDTLGHPKGDELLVLVARAIEASIRASDRAYRYGGDEFAVILAEVGRAGAEEVAARIRQAVEEVPDLPAAPDVTISVGIACHPEDGLDKATLVEVADRALYLAKGARLRGGSQDPFIAALDETALGLLDGIEPMRLVDTILARAAALLHTVHGYLYLVDPDGTHLVVRAGIGLFEGFAGYRLPLDRGVAGMVYRTRRPFVVDDYGAFADRAPELEALPIGSVIGVPLMIGGRVIGVIGLASGSGDRIFREQDIDAMSRFAQLASIALENARLQEEASRADPLDPVTRLPARQVLLSRVEQALDASVEGLPALEAGVAHPDAARVAVILLDVDRFKVVNESLGHAMGDRVLREVGRRLATVMGPDDLVARFGGDEFAMLLVPGDEERATEVANLVVSELRAPFDLDGRAWFIGASMGIGMGVAGEATVGDLLQQAEIALVQAQADPVVRFSLFDRVRSQEVLDRVDLEADLRAGIERGELVVHYQPIVSLEGERVVGFEALVRWQHPARGLIQPAAFIPLAEETELIVPLGRYVLGEACAQARDWRERWPEAKLVMSVNLSPRQFADPHLVDTVADVLETTGLDPRALELEITESTVMDRSEAGVAALRALRELGVRIVLDDFGTGYSSLAYLRHLPLDTIKIDRSFVTDLDLDDPNVAIVRAVLSLAHGLGITVVAEGIETASQARRLRALGCDLGQGYAWAHPAEPSSVEAMLSRGVLPPLPLPEVAPRSARAARLRSSFAQAV